MTCVLIVTGALETNLGKLGYDVWEGEEGGEFAAVAEGTRESLMAVVGSWAKRIVPLQWHPPLVVYKMTFAENDPGVDVCYPEIKRIGIAV